ncbi:MAG: late competence development ComFB family protein [Deferrisomatales bacterium]
MSICHIVRAALERGYLAPQDEDRLNRLCERGPALEVDEYEEIVRLKRAIQTGEVLVFPRKRFHNVMEELVEAAAMARVATLGRGPDDDLNVGDVVAYALNRLPPLYATSAEGAGFQRDRAAAELGGMVEARVADAVTQALAQPRFFPDREPLGTHESAELLPRLAELLQAYADDRVLADPAHGAL